jgi:hypothetical protein
LPSPKLSPPLPVGELDGEGADAPGRGVDQHGLAAPEAAGAEQGADLLGQEFPTKNLPKTFGEVMPESRQ